MIEHFRHDLGWPETIFLLGILAICVGYVIYDVASREIHRYEQARSGWAPMNRRTPVDTAAAVSPPPAAATPAFTDQDLGDDVFVRELERANQLLDNVVDTLDPYSRRVAS